jgi:GWxTD domain-containing protein
LISDDERPHIVSRRAADPGDIPEFSAEAAPWLVNWWHTRDPVPASPRNERLDEHLRRIAVAHRDYPDTTRAVGLDDRGLLFLRLGPPQHTRQVSFEDARFFLDVVRFGVSMTPRDFPENEIWLYPHIDRAVYHVFAQDHRRRYRTSTPTDLIPRRLQNATLSTDRQMNMAVSALAALRHVYRSLALTHSDFSSIYGSIEDYAMWQEERRMARMAGGPLEVGEVEYRVGAGASSVPIFVNPMRSIAPPNEFVRSSVSESLLNDDRARRARERVEPDDYFDVFAALDVDPLEASVRASRFRDRDGSTRLVIDWAPKPGALQLSRERLNRLEQAGNERYSDILLRATAVSFNTEGGEEGRLADSVAVMTTVAPNGVMLPRSMVLDQTPASGRIVLQLDRHAAVVKAGPPPVIVRGPPVQMGLWETAVERLPAGFAMSDIRPHFAALTPADAVPGADELVGASPFPHDFAPSQGTLILEFEMYGLARDQLGRTGYAVEYEVARREAGGAFRRLLGRARSDVTAARSEHRGEDTETRERIVLDPSEWADGAEIRITIRVTDLNAERVIERSLEFQS